jgi:hypothetical protein
MIVTAIRGANPSDARAVPLMVPHGGAEAGRDFESAFEMLRDNGRARELWRRARIRIPFARAS